MKAVQEPAPDGCFGGVLDGGDTGKPWPATVHPPSTAVGFLALGWERCGWVRLVCGVGTLLGPERTTSRWGWSFGEIDMADIACHGTAFVVVASLVGLWVWVRAVCGGGGLRVC